MKSSRAIAVCCLAFTSAAALAVDLDPTTFEESVGGAQTSVTGVDPFLPETVFIAVSTENYGSADGVAATAGGALPSVHAALDLTGYAPYGTAGGGSARIFYYWAVEQIEGDPYDGLVPVVVNASGSVSRSAAGGVGLGVLYAYATFNLHHELVQLEASLCDAQGCYVGAEDYAETFTAQVARDAPYSVQLYAYGYDSVTPGATVSFDAAVDAWMFIDPAFPLAAQFRLVYGAGILPAADGDGDGLPDGADNCTLAANADQRDTDGDGIGNLCDPDLNNDCLVNFTDLAAMKSVFFSADPDADLNGDGAVNFGDVGILKAFFFAAPGPSGLPDPCDAG